MVGEAHHDKSEAEVVPTDLIAFFDESKRPVRDRATNKVIANSEFYVVASAVVLQGDLDGFRAQVAKLEADLGFSLHYYDLNSRARLTAAVEAIDSIEGWDSYLFETGAPISSAAGMEHHARAKALEDAFVHLSTDGGVSRAVLETRAKPTGTGLDRRDHQVLGKLRSGQRLPAEFKISHVRKDELLLGLPDILASARTDYLCAKDDEPFLRIAHRVSEIRQI